MERIGQQHTAGAGLVAITLGQTSGRLVLEVCLSVGSGSATSADSDRGQHDDDDHAQCTDD